MIKTDILRRLYFFFTFLSDSSPCDITKHDKRRAEFVEGAFGLNRYALRILLLCNDTDVFVIFDIFIVTIDSLTVFKGKGNEGF